MYIYIHDNDSPRDKKRAETKNRGDRGNFSGLPTFIAFTIVCKGRNESKRIKVNMGDMGEKWRV